ncbi:MAG: alpha-glucan family phosphorylase [Pyrinomonadaceae bacterium]
MSRTFDEVEWEEQEQRRVLPKPLSALEKLSWNYWWYWAPDGAQVFRDLDPDTWDRYENNARLLLRETTDFRLAQVATDPVYIERVRKLESDFERYMSADSQTWASENLKNITAQNPVAYFCAEFGVHHSLPLYSGGLGILAGDHLKSASDLGLPLVAIGLMYRYGYFRQRLTREGWQQELYGENSPENLPTTLLRDEDGNPILVEVEMRGRIVSAQTWRVDVGRVKLYLLDTNIQENDETDRWVTAHLYGGDRETRIVQEMMLGIGGVRLLRRLNITPSVYHLNEGHSAFLTLELTRELMSKDAASNFTAASKEVRDLCVFTTHTPIAAGNDEFDPQLIEACFGEYRQGLGLSVDEFLALGSVSGKGPETLFGLTPLAIRMCRSTNGVSAKHGEVSRALWSEMWPDRGSDEVPITSVTNGVHVTTWISSLLRALYEKHIGLNWTDLLRDPKQWSAAVAKISDEELWEVHRLLKQRLVAYIRYRLYYSRLLRGESMESAEASKSVFDPEALIIGFARRVAAYKRWDLLLNDTERLLRLINDDKRPVQFVFAGKAHPQDAGAKVILQRVSQWRNDPRVDRRVVFLEDYDQEVARQLVQAVDVWMNVPRRPLEASGTSGQKVALNGGLNLSILDGWWIEGYDGTNGWAIGDPTADTVTEAADQRDADSLYTVIESEVVPFYYDRSESGVPHRWVAMMRRSIETLTPTFSSDRMVQEYAERIYTRNIA